MLYHILDTETASLQGGVCEIAWLVVDDNLDVQSEFCSLVNPEIPISEGAKAVHGISDEDVADKPTLAQIAQEHLPEPITIVGHNCVTGDHEVLTKQGWKRLDTISDGELIEDVLVWNTDNTAKFSSAVGVVRDFSGQLLAWDTQYHKGVYTPQHKFVYSNASRDTTGKPGHWKTDTAEVYSEYGANNHVIPTAGILDSGHLQMSEAEARILEMTRADGSIEKRSISIRFHFKKDFKIARCKELLTAAGLDFKEVSYTEGRTTVIRLSKSYLAEKIVNLLGRGKEKGYGSWVLSLPLSARLAILDETKYWDANKLSTCANEQTKITSSKVEDLTWLQALSVISGKGAVMSDMKPNTKGFSTSQSVLGSVSLRTRCYAKTLKKPQYVSHDGKVYCLTTDTGFFFVRRNGAVWVTGNCSFDIRMIKSSIKCSDSICTLALARKYIKGTTNHKLETLQAELHFPEQKSHSALGDVYTARDLLLHLNSKFDVTLRSALAESKIPKLVHLMPFGKHKGRALLQIPRDYREWLLKQELDKDLRFSLEKIRSI